MAKRKQTETPRIPTQSECDSLTCDCIAQCKRIYPPRGTAHMEDGTDAT